MAEVAGLVLGGIPIAIWALEKYAEPFETHQNYYVAIQTLRADLTMQKSQLEITLRNIGLENPSVDELQECLSAKFPSIHQDLAVIIKAMDERTSKLLRDLDIDVNGKAIQDTTLPPPSPAQFIANLCGQVRTQCTPWCITGCLRDPEADKDPQFSHFSLNQHSEELSGLTRTISLRHLLLNQNRRQAHAHLALSAKQRYAIATSIAWSVLHLSDSPWLGEGWDQDEIKFFVDEGSEGMQLVSQFPSNSYAFHEPTTLDQPLSSSTKDFSRLIPNKTIFTLGVILIELCLKTPFEELRQTLHDESRGQAVSAPILDQYDTAIDRLDDVYREAGDSYGNAVQRCIKSSFQGPKSTRQFNVEQFRIQFYNTVVAPVQATYSMMP
ncbi:hypothetical protein NW754_001637 [Fusarium falciforme]|nr:hypothetical protein NW754_001637 [Fusarium falciforme]